MIAALLPQWQLCDRDVQSAPGVRTDPAAENVGGATYNFLYLEHVTYLHCIFLEAHSTCTCRLSHCDIVRTARFKLGSHFLGVEKGRFNKVPWPQRRCTRCCDEHLRSLSCPVDDEVHLVFDCEAFENLRVDKVLDALQWIDPGLFC